MTDRLLAICQVIFVGSKVDSAADILIQNFNQAIKEVQTPHIKGEFVARYLLNSFFELRLNDIEANTFENLDIFLNIFRLYCNTNANADCANSFIEGFGNRFEDFTKEQLIHFCVSLGQANLQ